MKKYILSFVRFLIIYLLGFIVFFIMNYAVSLVYGTLSDMFPAIFRTYNFITEPEEAEALSERLKLTAGILSVLALGIIALKYDNARYEYIISRTDGFYTLKEGAPLYLSGYLYADIIAAAGVPLITYPLVLINIGESAPRFLRVLEKYINGFTALPLSYRNAAGLLGGALLLVLTSLAARALGVYSGLKRWRAVWLSDIGREDAQA